MIEYKFGEFDSAEEINKTAEGLKAEGDERAKGEYMNKKDIFMRAAMTYFKAMHRDERLYDALQSVNISYNDDADRETYIWTDIEDLICELVGDPTGIALEEITDRAWKYADKKTLPKAEIMKWLEEMWNDYTGGKEA